MFEVGGEGFEGFGEVAAFEADVADAAGGFGLDFEEAAAVGEGAGHFGDDGDAEAGADEFKDGEELVGFELAGKAGAGAAAEVEGFVAEAVAVLEDEEAFLGEAAELDFGGGGEGVGVGDGEVEGIAEEFGHDEAGVFDGEAEDGEVEGAVEDLFDEFGGATFPDVEVDVGEAFEEAFETGGEVVGQDGGDGADAEWAVDAFAGAVAEVGQRGGVLDEGLGPGEDGLTEGGEFDAAVEALEEGAAEALFEAGDVFGEGGLGDAEVVGGLGEAGGAGDGAEAFELAEVKGAGALRHREFRWD